MNYVQANCPHCGKELPIPDDAETITCMYCAQSIDVHAVLQAKAEKQNDSRESLKQAEESLPEDLFNQAIMQDFNAKHYPDLFQEYCAALAPALGKFDSACHAAENSKEAADSFTETLLNRFEKAFTEDGIKKPSDYRFVNYVYMLVSFLIPAILEHCSAYSESLADTFLAKWKITYPKNPLGKATYEEIKSGFKTKLCFITTAACQILNKPDNCYELNAFRSFRDNWLLQTADGAAKVQEYYLFAPIIVQAIDRSPHKENVYCEIWHDYLAPCLDDIEHNRQKDCAERYEKMVKDLELKWL